MFGIYTYIHQLCSFQNTKKECSHFLRLVKLFHFWSHSNQILSIEC